jgi:hypothetical protein
MPIGQFPCDLQGVYATCLPFMMMHWGGKLYNAATLGVKWAFELKPHREGTSQSKL